MSSKRPPLAEPSTLRVELQRSDGSWLTVGNLKRSGEVNWFESVPEYWESDQRAILGQVFEERGRTWRPSARVALPTWFSHLLPEGRLRQAVAEAADVNERREFFLLWRVGGDDLPGAVRIVSAEADEGAPPALDADDVLDEDAAAVLKFSLAGVQLKFSVVRHGERGLTVPARGQAGEWIAKLPDQRPSFEGVPEAEFAGLELARRVGIVVPEIELVDVSSIAALPDWSTKHGKIALLVKRFDRAPNGRRVHVEELAQVLDIPTGHHLFKYRRLNFETVASVTSALCGPEAVGEVVDRIVLNVLLGNGDAHAKNWAYRYPDGWSAELSPAYDIVPTVLYIPGDDLGVKLAGSRRFDDVTVASFDRLGVRAGWTSADIRRRVRDAVERVIDAWPILVELLPSEAVKTLTTRRDGLALTHRT